MSTGLAIRFLGWGIFEFDHGWDWMGKDREVNPRGGGVWDWLTFPGKPTPTTVARGGTKSG